MATFALPAVPFGFLFACCEAVIAAVRCKQITYQMEYCYESIFVHQEKYIEKIEVIYLKFIGLWMFKL